MINFYKIVSYFLSILIGLSGFLILALSVRDLLFIHENQIEAFFAVLLGTIMILTSYTIYDSLWRF